MSLLLLVAFLIGCSTLPRQGSFMIVSDRQMESVNAGIRLKLPDYMKSVVAAPRPEASDKIFSLNTYNDTSSISAFFSAPNYPAWFRIKVLDSRVDLTTPENIAARWLVSGAVETSSGLSQMNSMLNGDPNENFAYLGSYTLGEFQYSVAVANYPGGSIEVIGFSKKSRYNDIKHMTDEVLQGVSLLE